MQIVITRIVRVFFLQVCFVTSILRQNQPFSHCCFPQITFCQDYIIAALENCGVWALASRLGFFKVNPSHFLQEVSRKLGAVMFLPHFSDINHYYVHPRSQVLPGRFWWWGGFPGQPAVRTSSSGTGWVMYAESNSITCKQFSCWPGKKSLAPFIQQLPATIHNCIPSADGTKMGELSILFKDIWRGNQPSPTNNFIQFSKSSL